MRRDLIHLKSNRSALTVRREMFCQEQSDRQLVYQANFVQAPVSNGVPGGDGQMVSEASPYR
jgi:hypothetical protein